MKYLAVSGFLVVVTALTAACSGSTDRAGALQEPPAGGASAAGGRTSTGGKGGTAGKGGAAGAKGQQDGGDGDAGPPAFEDAGSFGPIVAITSPTVAADPDQGPVIVNDGTQVEVVCTAVARDGTGSSAVAEGTVAIAMLDAAGKTVQAGAVAPTKKNPGEYSAKFTVGTVPNGSISFGCSASDKSGHPSTTKITTLIDQGPDITRGKPVDGSPYRLAALDVDFSVAASPLAATDKGAAVAKVTLSINGQDIDLTNAVVPNKPGHYVPSVDLSDQKLFGATKLNGPIVVQITATNVRGVTRTDTYHIVVDSEPPKIVITAPSNDDIIGGKRSLVFTVTDTGSGVKKATVKVQVNQDTHPYDTAGLWSESNGTYTFSLDSASITGATVQINVNVSASDLAGNDGAPVSATYYLDTRSPIVDMDPPSIQEVNSKGLCSEPFDPLGDVVNDSTDAAPFIVHSFGTIRALAWDQENGAQDEPLPRFAGVNPSSVQLYVQGNPSAGLLIDTDGDGTCDEIDPALGLPLKDLHPVAPNQGASSYKASSSISEIALDPVTGEPIRDPVTGTPVIKAICATGTDVNAPPALCTNTSDLSRVIQHEQRGGTPEAVVYSLLASGGECNASQLQFSSMRGVTANGWICLATRAVDRANNIGVSAPIRLCLDAAELGGHPDCALMSTSLPSCTTNCALPARFFENNFPHTKHYIYLPQ